MLVVDSNKRIKLHEIRQLPWFQQDLPAYLFAPAPAAPPADPPLDDRDSGSPTALAAQLVDPVWTPEEQQEGVVSRRREWVAGLGVVDQEIVDDLCGKIGGLASEHVWTTLQSGQDKELRIAYQLCRDNKRMVEGCEFCSVISTFPTP